MRTNKNSPAKCTPQEVDAAVGCVPVVVCAAFVGGVEIPMEWSEWNSMPKVMLVRNHRARVAKCFYGYGLSAVRAAAAAAKRGHTIEISWCACAW